jgi:uncharacterized protein (DUF1501 family)
MTPKNGDRFRAETTMSTFHASTRRDLLRASGVLFAWSCLPKLARAEGRDPRLLVVVLRGALDGLAAVAPVGDPGWEALRGAHGLRADGPAPGLRLNDFFVLNPAMPNLHRLYQAGAASIVHAVATPYRERSHFDGQDVLESGRAAPGVADTGWLNRALAAMTPGGRVDPAGSQGGPQGSPETGNGKAFALGPMIPLVARGPAPVLAWTPPRLQPATDDTLMRLLDLYRHTDVEMARALEERIGLAAIARAGGMETGPAGQMQPNQTRPAGSAQGSPAPGANQVRAFFAESAGSAAKFISRPDGPRVGAIAFDGWDTHANEGPLNGRLAALLGALDSAIGAVETGMGPAWRDTVVAVVTEFGRTARINGTDGTDHGTATVALLAGGAVKGGRVIADWPGLREADLHEKRDLRPTTDLRAVLKGVLRDHLRVPDAALAASVFPDSAGAKPVGGLVA